MSRISKQKKFLKKLHGELVEKEGKRLSPKIEGINQYYHIYFRDEDREYYADFDDEEILYLFIQDSDCYRLAEYHKEYGMLQCHPSLLT